MDERHEHLVWFGSPTLDVNWEICEAQSEIYEHVWTIGLDINVFSDAYLRSDFCEKGFDSIYSRHHNLLGEENWDYLQHEIGGLIPKASEKSDIIKMEAKWIGFIYRALYIETGVPSKILVDKVPFHLMRNYFTSSWNLDNDIATNEICEDCGLKKLSQWDYSGSLRK